MNTSLSIKMKSTANKDLQKSITYVSASASSADLLSMAQGLTGLTTNTYESADRVQKINIDTEQLPVTAKPVPTLSVTDNGSSKGTITYTGDGTLIAYSQSGECTISGSTLTASTSYDYNTTGVICATETENYASTWTQFTVTGGAD